MGKFRLAMQSKNTKTYFQNSNVYGTALAMLHHRHFTMHYTFINIIWIRFVFRE